MEAGVDRYSDRLRNSADMSGCHLESHLLPRMDDGARFEDVSLKCDGDKTICAVHFVGKKNAN